MPHKSLGRSLAREDAPIARAVGDRIRAERLRAKLTQQQLADGRYTKAYISALENGLAKPSLAALTFISTKLGLPASFFLTDAEPAWSRVEADLALVSGDWLAAADAYTSLLEAETQPIRRAELSRGLAEACYRLERPAEALAAATSAAAAFDEAGLAADAALARYWLGGAQYQLENDVEARSVFRSLLDAVRGGLRAEPEFEARLLIALAAVDGRSAEPKRALAYLGEAQAVLERFTDRRRAFYLQTLAVSYREGGDTEAAIRLANRAIASFRELEADSDVAILENELALNHLALRATRRAREHAAAALAILRRLGDEHGAAHVLETQAQVELAAGSPDDAAERATEAVELADRTGNRKAAISARLTLGRARRAQGRPDEAATSLDQAARLAREHGRIPQLRDVLAEWADLRAAAGDAAGAYELSREALALARN